MEMIKDDLNYREIAEAIADNMGLKWNTHGGITSPGKFERTTLLGVYLYDQVLNGFGEMIEHSNGDVVTRFELTHKEHSDLVIRLTGMSAPADRYQYDLFVNDDGFVYCTLV